MVCGASPGDSSSISSRMPASTTAIQPPSKIDGLQLAVMALIFGQVWRIQDFYPVLAAVKFPTLSLAAAVGFFVLDGDPRRRIVAIQHSRLVRMMIALAAVLVIGVPAGIYPGRTFTFVTSDYLPMLVYALLMALSIRDIHDVRRYAFAMICGGIFYAGYVHLFFTVGIGGRLGNLVYYDANDLAALLVWTLPFIIYAARSKGMVGKGLALVGIPLYVMVIMKSGSRGGFLGFVAVMLFVLLRYDVVSAKVRMGVVTAAVGLLAMVGSAEYWANMKTLLNPKDDYNWSGNSESGRMEVWKRGMGYMITHPFVGVGGRNFPIAEGTLSEQGRLTEELGIGFKWSAPHNSFVEIGAEAGVTGLALFLGMLGWSFANLRRIKRASGGKSDADIEFRSLALSGSGAFVGYCVAGFFVTGAFMPLLYTLFALAMGITKVHAWHAAQSRSSATGAPLETAPRRVVRRRGGLAPVA